MYGKTLICQWRLPPPPPPTLVVLYVEATVCLKPSSPPAPCSVSAFAEPLASGWVLFSHFYPASNGSGTSEDLFWKLDALQTFIRDLHWPEEEFGKHLEQRLKLMASDMIESCVKRWAQVAGQVLHTFPAVHWLRKGWVDALSQPSFGVSGRRWLLVIVSWSGDHTTASVHLTTSCQTQQKGAQIKAAHVFIQLCEERVLLVSISLIPISVWHKMFS